MAVHQPTGRVLWRSPALVSNTATAVAIDDFLVVGYGFTAEPDFVYLLDRNTGAVRGRLAVPDGPELIAREGQRRVRVRTYSRDMLIEIGARPSRN
jgi:hypothetical protein